MQAKKPVNWPIDVAAASGIRSVRRSGERSTNQTLSQRKLLKILRSYPADRVLPRCDSSIIEDRKTKRSNIALVVPSIDKGFAPLVQSISETAEKLGFEIIIGISN